VPGGALAREEPSQPAQLGRQLMPEAGLARCGQAVNGDPEPARTQPRDLSGYLPDYCRPLSGRRRRQRLAPRGHGLERLHVPTIRTPPPEYRGYLTTESDRRLW